MTPPKAILVKLHIRKFCNSRTDPSITQGVKDLHKLTGNAGRWVKNKLPQGCLDDVNKAASEVYRIHRQRTLTWEEGTHLLPLAGRPKYEQDILVAKGGFIAAVEGFALSYPMFVDEARNMHAKTWNPADYPAAESIRECFGVQTLFYPLPASSHFNSELSELYGPQLDQQTAEKTAEAVKETWDRLLAPVRHMVAKLKDEDGEFRDSLVGNIHEMLELMPALALTDNGLMKQACDEIRETLGKTQPDQLRKNKAVREATAKAAQDLVSKFSVMGTRQFSLD